MRLLRGPLGGGKSVEDDLRVSLKEEGLSPEKKLWLAVYYRAVYDYRSWKVGKLPKEERFWGEQAEWWLFRSQETGITSLAWIANVLDVPLEKMRGWALMASEKEVFSPCAWKGIEQQKKSEEFEE